MGQSSNPNTPPASLNVKHEITFSTTITSTGDPLTENFKVSGPSEVSIITIPGNKAVIPLKSTLNQGDPFIKLHFPMGASNTMYITYAKKDSNYLDGYEDLNSINSNYKNDLKNWISGGSTPLPGVTVKKTLTFSAYGVDSNKPSDSVPFSVTFQYTTSSTGGGGGVSL